MALSLREYEMNANNFSICRQFSMVVVRDKYTKEFRLFTLILQKTKKKRINPIQFSSFFFWLRRKYWLSLNSWRNCTGSKLFFDVH